ncbi:MAG TPA: CoA-binding protein [Thermodesulfobacteriota bacterium]
MSDDAVADCLARPTWAIVGASKDRSKFGNMVYFDLRAGGYRVMAVNPNATQVEGDPAWPTLASLPERPDVVDFVTPPEVTARVVEEALALGITRLWFQPGSATPETLERARAVGATVVSGCAMTERHRRGSRPAL